MILFGGLNGSTLTELNETWAYNYTDNNWSNRAPSVAPDVRRQHAMVYDSANNKTVLFGGYESSLYNDTWVYDYTDNAWTNMNPTTYPNPRRLHTMVFDSRNNLTMMFGGITWSQYCRNDTWGYNYTTDTWTNLNPATSPSVRRSHAMVYNSVNDTMILFGGYNGTYLTDIYLNDTWAYNYTLNTWTQRNPATSPSARMSYAMVYDIANNRIILFGGYNGSYLGDTWVYDYSTDTWTNMNPATSPSARSGHTMAYDSANNRVVLFGGYDGSSYLSDTWIYNYGTNTWTQVNPSTSPSVRSEHAMVYDSVKNRCVLFGGYNGTARLYDTWVYSYADGIWVETEKYEPGRRSGHAMAYDTGNGRVVFFGGYDGASRQSDTWTYRSATVVYYSVWDTTYSTWLWDPTERGAYAQNGTADYVWVEMDLMIPNNALNGTYAGEIRFFFEAEAEV
jgi:hypothetical protein